MIYITGDCHGNYQRFNTKNFPEQKNLSKEDYVIICGDFGLWDESREQKWWLQWLSEKPFTTLWVAGNHENFDLLQDYSIEEWKGGKVQFITPSILHLMRGQIYTIEEKTFFCFGGAESHDAAAILDPDNPNFQRQKQYFKKRKIPFRVNHISWWKEELPCEEELREGLSNLEKYHNCVDYIITHCAPLSLERKIVEEKRNPNILTTYLEEQIYQKVKYRTWFFGHYHSEEQVGEREVLLYQKIVPIK